MTKEQKDDKRLTELRHEIFDLANSYAGDERGNVAAYLHAAASEISRAQKALAKGNKWKEVPVRLMLQSMGIGLDPIDRE